VIVMDALSNSVLVLNASYEPIDVVSAKRALVLICKGAAIVQERSAQILRTARMNFPLPAVIRLLSYRNIPRPTHASLEKGHHAPRRVRVPVLPKGIVFGQAHAGPRDAEVARWKVDLGKPGCLLLPPK
jgi:hypothetical protein